MGDAAVVLQRHDEDLDRLLHQLLPVVGEEQVVVRDAVAHRVVGAHHVEQGGEERQGVSGGVTRRSDNELFFNMSHHRLVIPQRLRTFAHLLVTRSNLHCLLVRVGPDRSASLQKKEAELTGVS